MDLYTLFRLPQSCSQQEIVEQYRKLSLEIYKKMRLAQGDGSELDIFYSQQKQLKDGLDILLHPQNRRSYDLFIQFNHENVTLPDSVEDFWNLILPTKAMPTLPAAIELSQKITGLDISSEYLSSFENYDEQVTATHIPKTSVYNELEVEKRTSTPHKESTPKVRSAVVSLEKDPDITQISPKAEALLDDNPTELFEKSPRLQQNTAPTDTRNNNIHSKAKSAVQRDRSQSNIEKIFSAYGHDGRFLREVRKLRGYSIEKLSNETMVAEEYIQHIEANAFDQLPAELYTMNYIKRIAGVLHISDRNIVDDYMRMYHNQMR